MEGTEKVSLISNPQKISWQVKFNPSSASFFSYSAKYKFLDQKCFGVLYMRCFLGYLGRLGSIWGGAIVSSLI